MSTRRLLDLPVAARRRVDLPLWTRRHLLATGLGLGFALAGCGLGLPGGLFPDGGGAAVLSARPPSAPPAGPPPAPGTQALDLGTRRPVLLHVPPALPAGRPVPLVLALHGAGGDAAGGLAPLRSLADDRGLVLLAPSSGGATWDALLGGYGADARLVDRALRAVFALLPVDPARIAVAGFSDGASYALGLGLANGGLFRRIAAFSPGFVPPGPRAGRPAVFVAHGTADDVLPIDRTSRRIVPALREDGYDLTYREFAGPHVVPPEIAREAVDWLGGGAG